MGDCDTQMSIISPYLMKSEGNEYLHTTSITKLQKDPILYEYVTLLTLEMYTGILRKIRTTNGIVFETCANLLLSSRGNFCC